MALVCGWVRMKGRDRPIRSAHATKFAVSPPCSFIFVYVPVDHFCPAVRVVWFDWVLGWKIERLCSFPTSLPARALWRYSVVR